MCLTASWTTVLTETMPLPADYHTHTALCKHAQGHPADYALAAEAAGVPEMACTDHCPGGEGEYNLEHRMSLAQFPQYVEEVQEAQQAVGIPVLLGVEADYYPQCEDFLEPFLDAHPFDLVLGSVHWFDMGPPLGTGPNMWDFDDEYEFWAQYFFRISKLAKTGLYDIASHLDFPKRGRTPMSPSLIHSIVPPVLDDIAAAGMAIEINTSGWFNGAGSAFPDAKILSLARERYIPITFGSDAHRPQDAGRALKEGVALARAAGYAHYARFKNRVMQSMPLPEAEGVNTSAPG